jgi:hypothetical protein
MKCTMQSAVWSVNNVARLARFPLIRALDRWDSELDDELLHPAQRMTNPCALEFYDTMTKQFCQFVNDYYQHGLPRTTIGQ